MENTAYIAGAGDFTRRGFHPVRCDIVIAADGGFEALNRTGIRPSIILGDMDSIIHLPQGITHLRFPKKKDLTDLALAARFARARGFHNLKIYGATGGRIDHTLANFQLLAGLSRLGTRCVIIAPGFTMFALTDRSLFLPPLPRGTLVSVFCHGENASGVSLSGLKYPLSNDALSPFEPLGISNEALGQPIHIRVLKGTLLVTVLHESEKPLI